MNWDIFISHASEDKESFARPLAEYLRARGLRVWYDEFALRPGDSLRRSIDSGLGNCRLGVLVLSPSFFAKEWPQRELDGLVAREVGSKNLLFPIWHGIGREQIATHSPTLADRVALSASVGLGRIADAIMEVLSEQPESSSLPYTHDELRVTVNSDGQLVQSEAELVVSTQEALLAVETGVKPRLQIELSPEILWRRVRAKESLQRLGHPSLLEVHEKLKELDSRPDLSLHERERRLDCISVIREFSEQQELLEKLLVIALSEPVLRNSGYLNSARDIAAVISGIISLFFWDGVVPSGSTKIVLYRLSDPELYTSIRLSRDEFNSLMQAIGFESPMALTIKGGWRCTELAQETMLRKSIPALLREVYMMKGKIASYHPKPEYLNLSQWFLGLG